MTSVSDVVEAVRLGRLLATEAVAAGRYYVAVKPEAFVALLDDYERLGRLIDKAADDVEKYGNDNHQHVGAMTCLPQSGDRCDATAAYRNIAQIIRKTKEQS